MKMPLDIRIYVLKYYSGIPLIYSWVFLIQCTSNTKIIVYKYPGPVTMKLTFKAPITTAADDIHKYFFIVFQRK